MITLKEESFIIEQTFLGIIDIAIAIGEAEFGNIQLLDDTTQHLKIVAQRGFLPDWLNYWENVSSGEGSCGRAFDQAERIIIEDICHSPLFQGEALNIQLSAGVRAVQSTPIISRAGKIVGVFSTHYKFPHKPDKRALRVFDRLAQHAADSIEHIKMQTNLMQEQYKLKEELFIREESMSLLSHELKNSLTCSQN